jgi:GDP-L-fucose synthase
LYGPNDNYDLDSSHVLPAMIRKFHEAKDKVTLWGDGSAMREFLYVDDLANACIFALQNINFNSDFNKKHNTTHQVPWLNIGSKFETSIKELAELIAKTVDYHGEIIWDKSKPDGTPRKKLNTEKMERLGWVAKTNLKEGINLTFRHFKEELKNNTLRA